STGATLTRVSTAGVTVTCAVAEKPMKVAVMVAIPGPATPVTWPRLFWLLTGAAIGFDEDQVAIPVTFWVDPSLNTRVATSWTVCPTWSEATKGVTCSSLAVTWLHVSTVLSLCPMYIAVM